MQLTTVDNLSTSPSSSSESTTQSFTNRYSLDSNQDQKKDGNELQISKLFDQSALRRKILEIQKDSKLSVQEKAKLMQVLFKI